MKAAVARLAGMAPVQAFHRGRRGVGHSFGTTKVGGRGPKPILKALQRAQPSKFRRYDTRMSVLPAVEPDLCKLADLG